jgi:hypothetical protein
LDSVALSWEGFTASGRKAYIHAEQIREDKNDFDIAGIGIEIGAAGLGIPAFIFSVRYQSIPVPDWISLFRFRTNWMLESPTFRHSKKMYEGR